MRSPLRVIALAVLPAVLFAVLPAATAAALPAVPDTSRNEQWWFAAMRIGQVWALGARGQGVTVAVVDRGVDAGRPELAGRVLAGADVSGAGGDSRTDQDRPRGHGTAMAIEIAGQGGGRADLVGIAPEARILPITVSLATGTQDQDGLAIRAAVDRGAKVINLSLGSELACPTSVQSAVRYAVGHGAVVVASAGNEGSVGNPSESPANCAGVLAVGAVDADLRAWPKTTRQPYVDVAGPGVNMRTSTLAGTPGRSNGTSDATALTSASLALIWSKFPTLTNRQVVSRLLATVRDAGEPGRDDATGAGVIRPYAAITEQVPANAPNPVFDELNGLPSGSGTGSGGTGSGGTGSTGTGTPGPSGPARPSAPSAAGPQRPGNASGGGMSGSTIGLIGAGIVIAGLVVALVIALSRRRRIPAAGPPPSWPTPTWSPPTGQPPAPPPGPGQFGPGQFGPGQSGPGQSGPGQSGPYPQDRRY